MKRKLLIIVMMAATTFFWLPTDSNSVSAQGKSRSYGQDRGSRSGNWRSDQRRGRRRSGTYNGYRNYGQYRRTQVGNRRYRMARRYYWNDGVRLSRYVRVYY